MKSLAKAIATYNLANVIVESLNEHFPEYEVTVHNMNATLRHIEETQTSSLRGFVDIYNMRTSK